MDVPIGMVKWMRYLADWTCSHCRLEGRGPGTTEVVSKFEIEI